MFGIILILGGIVLRANEQWFNGAETCGTVMVIIGAIIMVLWLVMMIAGVSIFGSARKDFKDWRR